MRHAEITEKQELQKTPFYATIVCMNMRAARTNVAWDAILAAHVQSSAHERAALTAKGEISGSGAQYAVRNTQHVIRTA